MIFLFTFFIGGCSFNINSEETIDIQSEIDQNIGYSIAENFGYRHEFAEDAIKLVDYNDETGKMTIIAYTYVFSDETYEEFKADTLESCANVLQDVKRHQEIEEVDLIIETTLEDQQGNPVDYSVFNMIFKRDNLKRVNFNEFDPLLLNKKANFYIETPFEM